MEQKQVLTCISDFSYYVTIDAIICFILFINNKKHINYALTKTCVYNTFLYILAITTILNISKLKK